MIAPTLSAGERAAVLAAGEMTRVVYPGGSVVAMDGRKTLFASGSAASFAALWAQAEAARKEARR